MHAFIMGEKKSGKSTLIRSIIKTDCFSNNAKDKNFTNSKNNILIRNNVYLQFVEYSKLNMNLTDVNFIFIVFDLSKWSIIERFLLIQKDFSTKKNTIIILNKIDLIKKKNKILPIMNKFRKKNYKNIFLTSAINNNGIKDIKKILFYKISSYTEKFQTSYFNKCNIKELFLKILKEEIYRNIKNNIYEEVKNRINFWHERKEYIIIGFDIIINKRILKNELLNNKAKKMKNININIKIKLEKLVKKNTYIYSFLKDK